MVNKLYFNVTVIFLMMAFSHSHADQRYNPISDQITLKECGECHMAFQPQMLPQRSWIAIMGKLNNHFGEDASLDKITIKHIEKYLINNSADAGWWSGKFMRGIKDNAAPIHITKTPYWLHKHDDDELPKQIWNNPKIKTKANCLACHPRAMQGDYDDD